MLQEFFINELDETIENEELYSIMNKRLGYKKHLNINHDKEKFGPGDICYLVKEVKTKSFLGLARKKVSKIGSYHYVHGLDTSNIAYISAYISKFIQKLNLTNTKITQSIFCVFDYFLEKDLRILIKFPGGVRKIFYIDDQEAVEANSEELRTVYLSSLLRSWNLKSINNNELYLEELNNINSFNYLIESIHLLVKDNLQLKNAKLKSKIITFLESFLKYLMDTRRINMAILNFSQLSNLDSSLTKYMIEPLKYLELYKDALSYIASSILNSRSHENLHIEIDLLTSLSNFEAAIEIGKYSTGLHPEISELWISLANVYLKKKDYSNCLKVLNNLYALSDSSNDQSYYREEMHFEENPILKNKLNNYTIKYSEILIHQKNIIDTSYNNSQVYSNNNSEILYETIKNIFNSGFYKFDKTQLKIYYILLDIIKEINFESFHELKNKIFYSHDSSEKDVNRNIEIDSSCSSTERIKEIKQITKASSTLIERNKISMNPCLQQVIENLFEDLKIFGVMISENEGYFNMLYNKEDLCIWEIKFCIAIGVLAERLKYFNTSLNFYTKAVRHCYSKFVYIRIIKLNAKLKDYKAAMSTIAMMLSYIPSAQFKLVNRTPRWIDKIILRILYEHQIQEIISWISHSQIHIIEYVMKRVIQKYKNWIDTGHELHLVKE